MARPRNSAPTDSADARPASRISVPLAADGSVDWEGMRGSTRARLLDLGPDIAEKTILAQGGSVSEEESGVAEAFGVTSENVAATLDLINQASGLAFRVGTARFIKHPLKKDAAGRPVPLLIDADIITRAFTLTPAQHAELDPRATRLAQKHTPEWLKKNLDLYMLIGMYLKYTADNAKLALGAQIVRDLGKMQAKAANADATRTAPDTDAVSAQPVNGHAQEKIEVDWPTPDQVRGGTEYPPEMPLV